VTSGFSKPLALTNDVSEAVAAVLEAASRVELASTISALIPARSCKASSFSMLTGIDVESLAGTADEASASSGGSINPASAARAARAASVVAGPSDILNVAEGVD
jgi:hypothetical protein